MKFKIGLFGLLVYKYKAVYLCGCLLYELCQYFIRIIYIIFRLAKINDHKIVISNILGRGYSDHPKYIVDEINHRNKKYDIVWILRNKADATELPENVRWVELGSIKSIYELSTARLWIDNAEKRLSVIKRKNQLYLQTWHGFGPKNTIICGDIRNRELRLALAHNSNMIDELISNNSLLSSIYKVDFGYNGHILEIGFPRNDLFFSKSYRDIKMKISNYYNITINKKIVLYAPTYRQNIVISSYVLNYDGILRVLSNKYKGDWIFLLRLHPIVSSMSKKVYKYNDEVIDASNYLDMQELLLVSDVLITDYSSCMFDFALTKKPCFLYHPDRDEYNDTRGFCIQPEELPFPRASTNEELQEIIENFDQKSYEYGLDACFEKYHMIDDGHASQKVVDWIENKIKDNNQK